ncbi:ion_trans domain-containing protein [Pycnococcus provasolii]
MAPSTSPSFAAAGGTHTRHRPGHAPHAAAEDAAESTLHLLGGASGSGSGSGDSNSLNREAPPPPPVVPDMRLWSVPTAEALSSVKVPATMLHPESNAKRRWDLLVAAFLVRSCWSVPFYAAFASTLEESEHANEFTLSLLVDRICDAIFLLDVIVQFFTVPHEMLQPNDAAKPASASSKSTVDRERADLERAVESTAATHSTAQEVDHSAVMRRYISTWFWYDLLASIPLDLLYSIPERGISERLHRAVAQQGLTTNAGNHTRLEKIEYEVHNPFGRYILRLNTLLRLAHIHRYLRAFARADSIGIRLRYFFRLKHYHMELLKYALIIMCFWHFFACSFWIIAKGAKGGVQGHQWYQDLKHRYRTDPSATLMTKYLVASYHAMLMMVTVDNSFRPENDAERVFTLLLAIVGTFLVLYCISVVCKLIHEADSDVASLDLNLDVVGSIVARHKLGKGVLLPALRYIRLKHDLPHRTYEADKTWMRGNLPMSQRTEILLRMNRNVCRTCRYLSLVNGAGQHLRAHDLAAVLQACDWQAFLPGETLQIAGRRPAGLHIILVGSVIMDGLRGDGPGSKGRRYVVGDTVGDALVLYIAQRLRRDPSWHPEFASPPISKHGVVAEAMTEVYTLTYRSLVRLWTHELPLVSRRAWCEVAAEQAESRGAPPELAQSARHAVMASNDEEWLLVDGEEDDTIHPRDLCFS